MTPLSASDDVVDRGQGEAAVIEVAVAHGSKSNAAPDSGARPLQNAFRYVSFTTPVLRCHRSVRGSSRSPVR